MIDQIEKEAQHVLDHPDDAQDIGLELCEYRWVEENFPDLVRQMVDKPSPATGTRLAREIVGAGR